jgi:alpha-1,2-mannosyltransferase
MLLSLAYYLLLSLTALLAVLGLYIRCSPKPHKLIGFFHPYCNQGGGGERVLWSIIKSLHITDPTLRFAIYTGDIEPGEQITFKALTMFGIDLAGIDISLVRLKRVRLIDPSRYPYLTMLLQFCGSFLLTCEAVLAQPVNVIFDTHGHPFGYWFVRGVCGISVVSYVHYPAISTDMVSRVRALRPSYNNGTRIANSQTVSRFKVLYYFALMLGYSFMGLFVKLAICNSTWTAGHIRTLWKTAVKVVYPPCDVQAFKKLRHKSITRHVAVSIGQFRPEKDHELQIEAFAIMVRDHPELSNSKLVLIGSCRGEEDEARVAALQDKARGLGLGDRVEFKLNVKFAELLSVVETAEAGLHTMWNEHFGISVVELMAAGLITLAHNSGGPKSDIITPGENGFLAETAEEYADLLRHVFTAYPELTDIRHNAKESVERFSDQEFSRSITEVLRGIAW